MRRNRIAAVLLLLSLLVAPLCAPAEGEKTFALMGLDNDGSDRSWVDSRFFSRMQERTGISFTFQQYNDTAAYQAAKDSAFGGNTPLPDALFKANLSPQEEMAYLASGQLVDLAPYLEEYAPTLFGILESRPDWRAIITQSNGAITSLPVLTGADRQCCIWINGAWLEALGLAMPQTIEEYTQALRAFRDGDPNGNGRQDDEIPLSLVGPWEAKFLLHAWGLTPNDYNIYIDEDQSVRFAPLEPGFRDFVQWLHMALSEGLLDPQAFRQTQGARSTALTTDDTNAPMTIGGLVSIAPYTVVDMDDTASYAVLMPLAHEGTQRYRRLLNGVGRGAFAITSACEDIPALLSWVDYLYTEEGGRLAFAGLEGEDYTLESSGAWKWASGENYTMLTEIVSGSIIAGDSRTPGLEPAAFMRNSEIAADNHARRQVDLIRDMLVDPFPVTWPTDADREAQIAALQADLAAYVDTSIANFAMGLTPLTDEAWKAFEEELQALGVEKFLTLWQEKYNESLEVGAEGY